MSLRKGDQRRVNMKEVEQHLSTQGALQPSGEYPAVKKSCNPKSTNVWGKGPATKSDEFLEKFQRGGGVIFNPKVYVADFENFKQGFLSMKLTQTE